MAGVDLAMRLHHDYFLDKI